MPNLAESLNSWNSAGFGKILCKEISWLQPGTLPLHQGTSLGGQIDDSKVSVIFLNAHESGHTIHAQVAVFFTEIAAGCSCGDEPIPANAHCELNICISKSTAAAEITILQR